jgi:hypothetical protein
VQVAATFATVYFAYRITRLIGNFLAWTLIIVAFLLLTLRNVASLVVLLILPPEDLNRLIDQLGPAGVWPSQLASIGASILLMVGFYQLRKLFERKSKS